MSTVTTPAETASLKGIALGAAAYSLFAFHDALVKSVISDLPVVEILFIRSLVIVIGCLAIGRRGVLSDLRRSSGKHLMLLRAVLTLSAWCIEPAASDEPSMPARRSASPIPQSMLWKDCRSALSSLGNPIRR